jgi:hypothetical protein
MSDLDQDSIITIRWSALFDPPVNIEILSYAHSGDLLAEITALMILHGPPWKVRLEGPWLYLTIGNIHCKAMHQFAKTLIADYGCTPAHALRMASKHH